MTREVEALTTLATSNASTIEELENTTSEKVRLYNEMEQQLASNTLKAKSEEERFLKEKGALEAVIARTLDEKERQFRSQDKIFKETVKAIEFDFL